MGSVLDSGTAHTRYMRFESKFFAIVIVPQHSGIMNKERTKEMINFGTTFHGFDKDFLRDENIYMTPSTYRAKVVCTHINMY